MTQVLLLSVPFPDRDTAKIFCETCVQRRLVACTQILPQVETFYLWKGSLENHSEVIVLFKTAFALKDDLVRAILDSHPYECPAIFSCSMESLNPNYTAWLEESLSQRHSE